MRHPRNSMRKQPNGRQIVRLSRRSPGNVPASATGSLPLGGSSLSPSVSKAAGVLSVQPPGIPGRSHQLIPLEKKKKTQKKADHAARGRGGRCNGHRPPWGVIMGGQHATASRSGHENKSSDAAGLVPCSTQEGDLSLAVPCL